MNYDKTDNIIKWFLENPDPRTNELLSKEKARKEFAKKQLKVKKIK